MRRNSVCYQYKTSDATHGGRQPLVNDKTKHISVPRGGSHTQSENSASPIFSRELSWPEKRRCKGSHGSRKWRQLPVVPFLACSTHYPICSGGWDLCHLIHHCVDLHTLHCTTQILWRPPSQGSQFPTHMLPEHGAWKFTMIMTFDECRYILAMFSRYNQTKLLISKYIVFYCYTEKTVINCSIL